MKQPRSFEETVFEAMGDLLDRQSPASVAASGRPPETEAVSDDDVLARWDYEMSPDWLEQVAEDPTASDERKKLAEKVGPRVQQLEQQGAMGEALAMRRWPFREELITTGRPHIRAQVDFADSLAKKSAARREKQQADVMAAEGTY
jgi:hypothetical protein